MPSSSPDASLLESYMRQAKRHPLLDREQEHALAVRWAQDEDTAARKALIEANLRLVAKIAFQHRSAHMTALDLIQEGNLGLLHAVDRFDPERGTKLSTYAAWWIRAFILRAIVRNHGMVRAVTTQSGRRLFFTLRREQARLRREGLEPSAELLAEALDVSVEEVRKIDRHLSSPGESLHAPVGDEERGTLKIDLIADEATSPVAEAEETDFRDSVRAKLEAFGRTLSDRELEVFLERMMSPTPTPYRELAERWGVSRERARQVEKKVVGPLRRYLVAELGDTVGAALGNVAV